MIQQKFMYMKNTELMHELVEAIVEYDVDGDLFSHGIAEIIFERLTGKPLSRTEKK